ncbi:hypothetical protein F2Q69_00007742 [Brassica cretica]|uniref:Uncharacterized protein n=1 Tax=Brassica cretica TaxID=69181 RepID=A0A8S9PBG2_BRACR|nr:hypothetical protein F2Q69_00007742 [Brassica cretica]
MIDGSGYQGMWPREHGALVGTWPKGHVDLGARGSSGEHDVSRCFSEHGGTLLMSWRSWSEPDKSFGLEAGGRTQTRRQGPRPEGRNPEPGSRNPEPGGGNPEPGAGDNMIFFIGLRESHHGIKLLLNLDLIGDISPGEWAIIPDPMQRCGRHASMGMCLVSSCTLDSDDLEDEMLPPWWGLVRVGRRFDGEVGSVCIKGDASAHTPDAYTATVAILGLLASSRDCTLTFGRREVQHVRLGHNRCWDDLAPCLSQGKSTLLQVQTRPRPKKNPEKETSERRPVHAKPKGPATDNPVLMTTEASSVSPSGLTPTRENYSRPRAPLNPETSTRSRSVPGKFVPLQVRTRYRPKKNLGKKDSWSDVLSRGSLLRMSNSG